MHGMKIIPPHLVEAFGRRTRGDHIGFVELTPPLDMTTRELAEQTVEQGYRMIEYWSDGEETDDGLRIPIQTHIATQPLELFDPNDFVKYWNPDWELVRAGYGTPGGGFRGIRGGTFYDAEEDVSGHLSRRRNSQLLPDTAGQAGRQSRA